MRRRDKTRDEKGILEVPPRTVLGPLRVSIRLDGSTSSASDSSRLRIEGSDTELVFPNLSPPLCRTVS